MTRARIFRPSKTAMQSGRANSRTWLLEFAADGAHKGKKRPDDLMGWAGSADTLSQVSLGFDSLDEAKAFAERKGIAFDVCEDNRRQIKPRSYSENFR